MHLMSPFKYFITYCQSTCVCLCVNGLSCCLGLHLCFLNVVPSPTSCCAARGTAIDSYNLTAGGSSTHTANYTESFPMSPLSRQLILTSGELSDRNMF